MRELQLHFQPHFHNYNCRFGVTDLITNFCDYSSRFIFHGAHDDDRVPMQKTVDIGFLICASSDSDKQHFAAKMSLPVCWYDVTGQLKRDSMKEVFVIDDLSWRRHVLR